MPLLFASSVLAQGTLTIPASSTVYDRLESVSALYPTSGVFLGERSLSARQIGVMVRRLTAAVDGALPGARRDWARHQLSEIVTALRAPTAGMLDSNSFVSSAWRVNAGGTDAATLRLPNNGLGQLDATINAFDTRRDGWPMMRHAVFNATPTVTAAQNRIAWVVEPRFSQLWLDGRTSTDARLHRVYLRGRYRNLALRVGSDEMLWGQSPLSALFISGNAEPLPGIAIGPDTAFVLPWLFRYVGPARGTLVVADLGRTQTPRHAKYAAWQASIQPWSRFELGVAVAAQQGGKGAPKARFFERVIDLIPPIDALAPQHADLQFSNKLAGGNLRLRLPEGIDLYYELQIDDFDGRRLKSSLTEDAAHLVGVRVPILIGGGELAWRAEWHRTSLRLYEHAQFTSGVTYRGRIIGDRLGPNAAGLYLGAAWRPSPRSTFDILLASESRDTSKYTVTSSSVRDRGFQFIKTSNDPRARDRRVVASFDRAIGTQAVRVTVGANRRDSQNQFLVELSARSHALRVF